MIKIVKEIKDIYIIICNMGAIGAQRASYHIRLTETDGQTNPQR